MHPAYDCNMIYFALWNSLAPVYKTVPSRDKEEKFRRNLSLCLKQVYVE